MLVLVQCPSMLWGVHLALGPLPWWTEACTHPPLSTGNLWCCVSLQEIWVRHLDCISIAIEACSQIPNFDRAVLHKFSANSCTVQLLCCFPKKVAAGVCPSIETQGKGSGGTLCADLRGPKSLIMNLRVAVPSRPVRARIQASCAV